MIEKAVFSLRPISMAKKNSYRCHLQPHLSAGPDVWIVAIYSYLSTQRELTGTEHI